MMITGPDAIYRLVAGNAAIHHLAGAMSLGPA
jgi:hypothetical protein